MFYDFGIGFFWICAGVSLVLGTCTTCGMVIWTTLDEHRIRRNK